MSSSYSSAALLVTRISLLLIFFFHSLLRPHKISELHSHKFTPLPSWVEILVCIFFSSLFNFSLFFSLTNCPIYLIRTLNWRISTTSDTARRTMNTRDWFGIKFSYANSFLAIKSSLNCRLNYFSSLRFSSKWLKGPIRKRPVFTRTKFENFKSKIVMEFNTNSFP